MNVSSWDLITDVIVIGSGGAGLLAAITARDLGADVIVLEKSNMYGGTTALSGGCLWIPNNYLMRKEGINDSNSEAFSYLRSLCGPKVSEKMINTYIVESQSMLKYLEDNTVLVFRSLVEYPDYYPELPGGKPGGRTVEPIPIDGKKLLGEDIRKLRKPPKMALIMGRATVTAVEARLISRGKYSLAFKRLLSYYFSFDWFRYGFDTRLTMGLALIGGLKHAINNRKIPIYLTTKATKLIVEENIVKGLVAQKNGKEVRIKAKKGVIVASGGFSRNSELKKKFLGEPTDVNWSLAVKEDTGDGIIMCYEAGAKHDEYSAWWTPITIIPKEEYPWMILLERHMPHCIIVNRDGKRFVNEAAPYVDVGNAIRKMVNGSLINFPAFLIMDSKHRRNYICGPLLPGKFYPEILWRKKYRNWIKKARTIRELADQINVNPTNLEKTINEFNLNAREGIDPVFHKGESIYDNYYGDPGVGSNPNLAPLDKPPYYAIKIYPGELGTKGGVKTNEKAQVINREDEPIIGLYAAGNCTSTPFGTIYPGAGGTLGPALTFGYIAAKEIVK